MGAADVGSWDTKDLSAMARARGRDSPHSGNLPNPSPRPRPCTSTHAPVSLRRRAQPAPPAPRRPAPAHNCARGGRVSNGRTGAWTCRALLDPSRGDKGCSSQACPAGRCAHRSSELWLTGARSRLPSGAARRDPSSLAAPLAVRLSETFVLFPTQRVNNALALGTPKTCTCHRIKPAKGKVTAASPDRWRKLWAWRILYLRVHLSFLRNASPPVRVCARAAGLASWERVK